MKYRIVMSNGKEYLTEIDLDFLLHTIDHNTRFLGIGDRENAYKTVVNLHEIIAFEAIEDGE